MSAHAKILEWSKTQPAWRQDALRRLLTSTFGAADENEILELLKADQKLADTSLVAKPLLAEHLTQSGGGAEKITLVSLGSVQNTDQLAPDQKLPFASTGLTLVYGDNGSGKSGYVRIVKKACRARGMEDVRGNIFDPALIKPTATAEFEVLVGPKSESKKLTWNNKDVGPEELARVAVFDSKAAAIYVDGDNQVTYVPYNLDCFERLAKLCDRLKERLSAEQSKLKISVSTPVVVLAEGTASKVFLDALSSKTDQDVAAATSWEQKDSSRLVELRQLVSDPEKRAIALRQVHAQIKAIRETVEKARPFLLKESIDALREKKVLATETASASRLAAKDIFSGEPIAGVGGTAWRVLYEAAREFSIQEAYVGKSFPVIDDGAHCVLCQQTLSKEGKERLVRFEAYVQNAATKAADAAAAAWEEATNAFDEATKGLALMSAPLCAALKSEDEAFQIDLSTYLKEAITLRDLVKSQVVADGGAKLEKFPIAPIGPIDGFLAAVEAQAITAEAAGKGDAATKLRSELANLEARKLLSENKAQVQVRLTDLRTIDKLNNALKVCATTGISQKGSELIKQYVTAEFETALKVERKALGIQSIPLKLASSAPKGTVKHQLKLDKTTFGGNTSLILSEGEHRAVALASFLAELSVTPGGSPIVIDDPVSSLDHERRLRVAKRLVEEATKRQVIIFTHDLLFYMDMNLIATEKQAPLKRIGVRRGPKGFGTVDPDGDPWPAKALDRRRAWLEQQLKKVTTLHQDGATDEYDKEVRYFYDRLRETWERLIEEGIFANVVVRYRRAIQTKQLTGAVLDDEIVMRVYRGMTAVSENTGHDKPAAAGASLPDPDLIKQHYDDIVECISVVATASKAAEKRREKMEKPPVVPIVSPVKSQQA